MTARQDWAVCLLSLGLCASVFAAPAPEVPEPPKSPDNAATATLFADAPDIVTPIGATVDAHGRLFVVESNTHFRPKNYQGPATDRIRVFEDLHHSGKADHITTYYEAGKFLMNIVADRDGSMVVSSRNEIFRLNDPDGRGQATQRTTLAHLETAADYPHNGLHGLAIDCDGNIFFGIGENFGGLYTLIGADGEKFSEDKGCGSIFRIDAKGGKLTRIARGFWNPFGLGFDPAGNLWMVDNDPDGRPPSRLIQVFPGADYGFEFRYGRTGLHPLQAWDGELPGTLGMVSGVGEAPCLVQWHAGQLYVSSWRDHQVEGYSLIPRGATYTATMTPLVKGGEGFRPVGLAFAPDGTLYVTDWASGSYSVNRMGHIWKVVFSHPASTDTDFKLTEAMLKAQSLRKSDNFAELVAAMDDVDPAMAQAAQYGLSRLPAIEKIEWSSLTTSRQRIGFLAALLWRGTDAHPYVSAALKDPDDRVRQMGVRAVAEQQITASREDLSALLESQVLSPRLLGMTIAAINQLDGDKAAQIDSSKINGVLLARINNPQASEQTQATALRMLQASHPKIPLEQIGKFLKGKLAALKLQAVRYLNADSNAGRFDLLARVAEDAAEDVNVRAEAILGLSDDAAARVDLLLRLTHASEAAIRHEALRSLRPVGLKLSAAQKEELAQGVKQYPADADLVQRVSGPLLAGRPEELDIAAWQKKVEEAPGDPEAGRRIFFHPAAAGCYRCHQLEGRGRAIGPDLTMIGHSQTRQHVLESILNPSKEIAPLFTYWSITRKNGEQVDGMLLRRDGQAMEVYVDASGQEIKIREKDIIDRKIRKESLMPTGLVQGLTDQELRDLVAVLMEKR